MKTRTAIDPGTLGSISTFVERIRRAYPVRQILLYGSRARNDHRADSDVDVAVLLAGEKQRTMDVALEMTDLALDILIEKGLVISPFPIWSEDWDDPSRASNPWLIRTIKTEGVAL